MRRSVWSLVFAVATALTVSGCGPSAKSRAEFVRAIRSGNKSRVEAFLNNDPRLANQRGYPPLWIAASFGKVQIVELLLARGADPNRDYKGETALFPAVGKDRKAVFRLLVDAGASASVRNADGFTPLHKAADADNAEAIWSLVELGADINARSKNGITPLHNASEFQPNATRTLLALGADPDAEDKIGQTPRDIALDSHSGTKEIFSALGPDRPEQMSGDDADNYSGDVDVLSIKRAGWWQQSEFCEQQLQVKYRNYTDHAIDLCTFRVGVFVRGRLNRYVDCPSRGAAPGARGVAVGVIDFRELDGFYKTDNADIDYVVITVRPGMEGFLLDPVDEDPEPPTVS